MKSETLKVLLSLYEISRWRHEGPMNHASTGPMNRWFIGPTNVIFYVFR